MIRLQSNPVQQTDDEETSVIASQNPMDLIANKLYLGDERAASDRELLK